MPINGNNFLRWVGSFTKASFTLTPVNTTFNLYANEDFTVVQPLSLSSASFGINPLSLRVIYITDLLGADITLSRPLYWDGVSDLTVYRPLDLSVTTIKIGLKFSDLSGNEIPGVLACDISVSAVSAAWVEYPPSAYCTLDSFGNNTGYLAWTQLKLINASTLSDIIPLTLKDNSPSDMDYIAPITDYISCPVVGVGSYAPLVISNFTKNGADLGNFITITNVYLSSSNMGVGGAPIAINIACNITPGSSQRFNVPAIFWDNGLTLTYGITGNMATASPQRYWKSQTAGVVDDFPTGGAATVDNSGIYGNFAITVPTASTGIVIFAQ